MCNTSQKTYSSYCGHNSDEELRSICVGASVGHAHHKRTIVFQHRMEFVFKFATPNALSSSPCTCGVTSLNHKLLYHTVEDMSIVVTVIRVDTEVFHCLGAATERRCYEPQVSCTKLTILGRVLSGHRPGRYAGLRVSSV